MKVLLNSDIDNLGRKGDIVEVKGGYARNYLFARKLAILATKGAERQAELLRKVRAEREQKQKAQWEEVAKQIVDQPLQITARAGAEGTLFGSITTSDISEALEKKLGQSIDRRKVRVEAIKSVGAHPFEVELFPDVNASGVVQVDAAAE